MILDTIHKSADGFRFLDIVNDRLRTRSEKGFLHYSDYYRACAQYWCFDKSQANALLLLLINKGLVKKNRYGVLI